MKYLTDEQIEDARDADLLADRCKVIDVPPGCDIRFMIPRYGLPQRIRPRRPAWEPWPCWGRVKRSAPHTVELKQIQGAPPWRDSRKTIGELWVDAATEAAKEPKPKKRKWRLSSPLSWFGYEVGEW